MMNFRIVKQALIDTLGDAAAERFHVIGYQRQNKSSSQVKNNLRMVQCYFSEGNFPKSAGRMRGHKTHDLQIEIDLSASAAATGDLSILDNPAATAIQKAAAMAAVQEAAHNADVLIDELIEYVYQIIMDARNENLGIETGLISNRWISRIQKDTLLERGDLVVKTANLRYECRVQEDVLGDIGNEPETVVFNSGMGGDIESAGVEIENDNTEE